MVSYVAITSEDEDESEGPPDLASDDSSDEEEDGPPSLIDDSDSEDDEDFPERFFGAAPARVQKEADRVTKVKEGGPPIPVDHANLHLKKRRDCPACEGGKMETTPGFRVQEVEEGDTVDPKDEIVDQISDTIAKAVKEAHSRSSRNENGLLERAHICMAKNDFRTAVVLLKQARELEAQMENEVNINIEMK